MKTTTYKEQVAEIETLCKSLIEKSKEFAERNNANLYFDDLKYAISDLKEIENFLN